MDTFFSGSSDVALPEGGGRRTRATVDRSASDLEAGAPCFCDRCDESIPLSELAAGRARIVYGLAFCVRCFPLLEEQRYQIYFCDRCRVSIPLERIEGGEALAGDGHVYCERCRRRPSRAGRIARRAAIPSASLLVLLSGVAGLIWWPRKPPAPAPDFSTEIRAVRDRLETRLRVDCARDLTLLRALDEERATLADVIEKAGALRDRLRALGEAGPGADSAQPPDTDRR